MTPEAIKTFFDLNYVLLALGIGFIWKYVPALDKWWNQLIPYVNVAVYVVTKMLAPGDAHAADGTAVATGVGVVIGGLTNSFWASLIFDKFVKPMIEKFFGRHPSDIRHDKEAGLTVNVAKAKDPS